MPIQNLFINSPIGILEVKATDKNVIAVIFTSTLKSNHLVTEITQTISNEHPLLNECEKQLREYFDGKRRQFKLPLQQDGSDFQQQVWTALTAIPFGSTISYLQLSKRIGNPKAIRAVGTTNGKNAISIIVPCHRVIGSNGSLTGYGGDLWRKKWLLNHEAKYANGVQSLF